MPGLEYPMENRCEEGHYLLHCLWMELAKRTVEFAITYYKLDETEATKLRDRFLKPDSYRIVLVN